MLINVLEMITFIALTLYIILGGADYGAGILEIFRRPHSGDRLEKAVTNAIGPVWEANHIWLILIIVILFNGFPHLYTTLTTLLHVPMVAVLLGIVVRGVAFTFRHYDLFAGRPSKLYTLSFSLSSLWVSIWLGIIAGAMILGRLNFQSSSVFDMYYYPWLNGFCLALGIFVASVFTYLASSFLIGEAQDDEMRRYFLYRSHQSNLAMVFSGALVFLTAWLYDYNLMSRFATNAGSVLMLVLATISWIAQEFIRSKDKFWQRRILVVAQVIFILLGFFFIQAPVIIQTQQGPLTFGDTAAPEATLVQLILALVVGLFIILPCLGILFWIFKFKDNKQIA